MGETLNMNYNLFLKVVFLYNGGTDMGQLVRGFGLTESLMPLCLHSHQGRTSS